MYVCADTGTAYDDLIVRRDDKVMLLPDGDAYAIAGEDTSKVDRRCRGLGTLDEVVSVLDGVKPFPSALLAGTVGGQFGLYLHLEGALVGPLEDASVGSGGVPALAALRALQRWRSDTAGDVHRLRTAVDVTHGLVYGVTGPAGKVTQVCARLSRHDVGVIQGYETA